MQRDDLAAAVAELDRRRRHDVGRLRKRNHFRLRRQLQRTLCIGTVRELVVKRYVRAGGIYQHRIVPGLGLHEARQQRADAVAERIARIKLDEFLVVLDGVFSQYVVIGLARGTRGKIIRRIDGFLQRRRFGCCDRGIAKEVEIAGQLRAFPGGLLTIG